MRVRGFIGSRWESTIGITWLRYESWDPGNHKGLKIIVGIGFCGFNIDIYPISFKWSDKR